jgi:hypothetical protein
VYEKPNNQNRKSILDGFFHAKLQTGLNVYGLQFAKIKDVIVVSPEAV